MIAPTVDQAAVLRVQAQAAVRSGEFSRAHQLRAEADRLDREETAAHERARQAYLQRFGACMRHGFSQADAREQATLEATRVLS